MAKIANVALTNTFDTWRSRSNEAFDRLSQFAINNSSLYANTLTSNTAFTAKGTATVTGLLTASGRATVGTNLTVSGNTTTNKATVTSALTVSGNTTLGGASKTLTIGGAGATTNATGWFGVTGRQSISTNLFVGGNTSVIGLKANNSLGSSGYFLRTNGSTAYWDALPPSSQYLQVANAIATYATKASPTTSGVLAHTGRATISTNLTVSANTKVTGRLGVGGDPFSNVKFAIIDTTAIKIPSGNTAQRPTGGAGYLRYNVTLASFEGYNTSTSSWGSIGGGAVGNTNSVFWENDKTITANYTITANKNAGTFGPITLNSGVTVTVLANSTWSIV